MKLELSTVGNPDHGQNPNEELWGVPVRSATIEVDSFEEASMLCRQFIEVNELGGGNWSGGAITLKGKKIAYVSYNGSVWKITKDAPQYSGKNEKIELDFETNPFEMTKFKLKDEVRDKFSYEDEQGRLFVFRGKNYDEKLGCFTEFSLLNSTHPDFHSGYMLDLFAERWTLQTIKQKTKSIEKVEFYF